MYSPEQYTISVRLENHEGENLYVGRVEELADVMEFADTAEQSRRLVLDTIAIAMKMYEKENRPFPLPKPIKNAKYSGKITLRLPRSLHKDLALLADQDNISLNTLLVSLLASQAKAEQIIR